MAPRASYSTLEPPLVAGLAGPPHLGHLGKAGLRPGPGKQRLSSPACARSEVKLSVVTYLTNSIVDEILQELYHSHKSLVSQCRHALHVGITLPPPAPSPQASGR